VLKRSTNLLMGSLSIDDTTRRPVNNSLKHKQENITNQNNQLRTGKCQISHATGWSNVSCSENDSVRISSLLNFLIHNGHNSASGSGII